MGRHSGGADENSKAVGPGILGKLCRRCGGAVGAENVSFIGDAKFLQLFAGPLHNGPVAVGTHDNGDFFHVKHSFEKSFRLSAGTDSLMDD